MPQTPAAIPTPDQFDPLSDEVIQQPWTFYASLREHAPVYEMPGGYYVISRDEDVRAIALDTETFSSNLVAILLQGTDGVAQLMQAPDLGVGPVDVLALVDPPQHLRQRKLTQQAFSMRMVRRLDDFLTARVDALLDDVLADGDADWMADFAAAFPLSVILWMLGLPHEDLPQVKQWTDAAVALLSGTAGPQELMQAGLAGMQFFQYVTAHCERAVQERPDNLMGQLAEVTGKDGDDVLSFEEFASSVLQLIIAGAESSASNIANALRILAEQPERQRRLREHPEEIPAFIEEVLRLESPFQGHFRLVRKPVTLHGVQLEPGDRLMLLWAAANRDPARHADPEQVRIDREPIRGHLAFGHGIHHCLGAPLARREAEIALAAVFNRTRTFALAAPPRYVRSLFVRTLEALKLDVTPA